jgi:two-component system chemotaxis response regulator CheB
LGIIIPGMGDEGARGLKEKRDAGAYAFGENEETCVVYGMPKEAMKAVAVCEKIPFQQIAAKFCEVHAMITGRYLVARCLH